MDDCEVRKLLFDIQNVRTLRGSDEQGRPVVRYGTTTASERALEWLFHAFQPAIDRAVRERKRLDQEDARSIARLTLLETARQYVRSTTPFHFTISAILHSAISTASRTSGAVSVTATTAARYLRLMHEQGLDPVAAYDSCREQLLAPATFMAAHNAMGRTAGLCSVADADLTSMPSFEAAVVERQLPDWLYGLVTARQRMIVRVHLGFDDAETRRLLAGTPYLVGESLPIVQTAAVLAIPRSTAQREGQGIHDHAKRLARE